MYTLLAKFLQLVAMLGKTIQAVVGELGVFCTGYSAVVNRRDVIVY